MKQKPNFGITAVSAPLPTAGRTLWPINVCRGGHSSYRNHPLRIDGHHQYTDVGALPNDRRTYSLRIKSEHYGKYRRR